MADYRKMYHILCAAVDESIDPLERIPAASEQAELLRRALLEAEEIYVSSDERESDLRRLPSFERHFEAR